MFSAEKNILETFAIKEWKEKPKTSLQKKAIESLEAGHVLFFPHLNFSLSPKEQTFLSPDYADPHAKNISYHAKRHKLWGVQHLTDNQHVELKAMCHRFSEHALLLLKEMLPCYAEHLIIARTSFRPVEIKDRITSYRKDDKRLHVDAFPSNPNQGKRILRVFCNINPNNQDRVWRTGEPFKDVANRFLPQINHPLPGIASLLRLLKITQSHRTMYDHYMLHIHDLMKADVEYQKDAPQQTIGFPSGSTWIAQTDHVSHAAMEGQYVLEQTFYLPVAAMQDEMQSPLRILEQILKKPLV
jgi:hypothetical protein